MTDSAQTPRRLRADSGRNPDRFLARPRSPCALARAARPVPFSYYLVVVVARRARAMRARMREAGGTSQGAKMSDPPSRRYDDDEILNRIKDELGSTTPSQDVEILEAIGQEPEGVLELAGRVARNRKAKSKVGVFLASLRRGDAAGKAERERLTASERARRSYDAKLRDIERADPPDWTARERRLFAVDYALDNCGANGAARLEVEAELRREVDAELDGTERDFERDTPHRRLMLATHGPDAPLALQADAPVEHGIGARLATAERRCRAGAKCVISVAGGGANLSAIQDAATNGSGYCIPCHRKRLEARERRP